MMHMPWLSLLIALPILGACLSSLCSAPWTRCFALVAALLDLSISVFLWNCYDSLTTHTIQFTEYHAWIPTWHVFYALGLDGISLMCVLLTCFVTVLVLLFSWNSTHSKSYWTLFLLTQAAILGSLCALDAILFYFFWEFMLIPIYLSLGLFGMEKRIDAAMRIFLYHFLSSLLLLLGILYLGQCAHGFSIASFYQLTLSTHEQIFLFCVLTLACIIKLPLWPFHTWMLHLSTEAPATGSIALSLFMLKLGGYALLRFVLPVVPEACQIFAPWMIALSLISILGAGLMALAQMHMRKLVAYAAISHMGFVTLGFFMIYDASIHHAYLILEGAIVQLMTQALSIGGLFLIANSFESVPNTYRSLASAVPILSSLCMIFSLSNIGLPGTSGFVGEWMMFLGGVHAHPWAITLGLVSLIIGPAYTLWMYHRIFFSSIPHTIGRDLMPKDAQGPCRLALICIALAILWVGVYPRPWTDMLRNSTSLLLSQSAFHSSKGN